MKKLFLLACVVSLFLIPTLSNAGERFDLVFDHVEVSPNHTDWENYEVIFEKCSVTNMFGPPSTFSADSIIDEYMEGKKYKFPLDQKVIVSFIPSPKNNATSIYYLNAENTTLIIDENRCSFRAEAGYWSSDLPANTTLASCMQQFRSNTSLSSCVLKYDNNEEGTVSFFVRIDRTVIMDNVADKK
jgi:hypothetical protein